MEGCDTVIGFRTFVAKVLKVVKNDQSREDDVVEELVRRVKSEVKDIPQPRDYDLSDFRFHKAVQDTSETLLQIVSALVSDGEITKPSLTLAQIIQQHVAKTRNQTTLGLAVKLHHKYGSSELIRGLNEHGLVATYDEVIRFRRSAASYVSKNSTQFYKKLGLSSEIGPIFGWGDNFDLMVCSPNGQKSPHAMVAEFTQHPAGILEKGSASVGVM